ncbi:Uncharacterised protein [Mycobacteroides abscessus subsp. massiliense]|nr:Uncharacterised protein [Mycobacteroides abscessus subsp. massiliense]
MAFVLGDLVSAGQVGELMLVLFCLQVGRYPVVVGLA